MSASETRVDRACSRIPRVSLPLNPGCGSAGQRASDGRAGASNNDEE